MVKKGRGWAFTAHDFADLGDPRGVGMTLLVRDGKIRRIAPHLEVVRSEGHPPRVVPLRGVVPRHDAVALAVMIDACAAKHLHRRAGDVGDGRPAA